MKYTENLLQKLVVCSFIILASTPVGAQITPDNTLGAESSKITPNVPIGGAAADRIDGGATRGSNLFHSFSDFNINDGQRVYFGNPSGIQNILTRVTGGNASNILGTLGVDGGANLFLLNPNGIIFGQNARLDLRGSFVGTTANAIGFGEQGFFSATDPNSPPLLTVQPSALLYTQINGGGITNRARPQYAEQGSRYFVGGNVTFDGGGAFVVGNRLELGGLAGEGTVGLTGSGNELQLNFPQGVPRADVVLQNRSGASATNGGAIAVEAGNLNVSGNSFISTTLNAGEGSPNSRAGDVAINATGAVTVDGESGIFSSGFENSLGDSGNVTIDAQSIRLNNTSLIYTNSPKNRGSIRLNATSDVTLDGRSKIITIGRPTSIGNSGDITVNASNINLSNSSIISSGNAGQGQGGKTTLQATDAIALSSDSTIGSGIIPLESGVINIGVSGDIEIAARSLFLDGQDTSISSLNLSEGRAGDIRITTDDEISLNEDAFISSATNGQGDGGDIGLTTRSFALSNGSSITTRTAGSGNSGNLLVNASDSVTLSGTRVFIDPADGKNTITGSRLSTAALGSGGNSGQITINTGRLSIYDGGYLSTGTNFESGQAGDITINASDSFNLVGADPSGNPSNINTVNLGNRDAGDVTIKTGRLSIRDGALVSTGTNIGTGQGGDLTINASQGVEIIGASLDDSFDSALTTVSRGSGNAGRITIDTRRLSLSNGASINASTDGSGRGGDINVNATDSIEIAANPADTDFPDGIFTSTLSSGDAGNLSLRTQRLSVRNGGVVSASTDSTGKGGSVKVNASKSVEVVGISNDGKLPSVLSVRSQGKGAAGNITVNSPRISVRDRGSIIAQSNAVDGGDINLNADNLLLRRGGNISATAGLTQGSGNGGNITINAKTIAAVPKENSDITANAFKGNGGNITITTDGLFGIAPADDFTPFSDIIARSELGVQGQIDITEPNVQPTQGLVELPAQVLDASDQIASVCPRGNIAKRPLGEFVVSGRGSLPPNPLELLPGTTSLSPLASLDGDLQASQPQQTSSQPATTATPQTIVEAQGWIKTADGKIALVASAPQATPSAPPTASACPQPNQK